MLDFPGPPLVDGQQYSAPNGITYEWQVPPGIWVALTTGSASFTGTGAFVLQTSPELLGTPKTPTPVIDSDGLLIPNTSWVRDQGYLTNIDLVEANSLAELKGLATPYPGPITTAYRTQHGDGGGGTWEFISGNRSVNVAGDPGQGLWVAPNSDSTGASGAWYRQFNGPMFLRWFGANAAGNVAVPDTVAINNAILAQKTFGIPIDGENLLYATAGAHLVQYSGFWLQNARFINTDHTTSNHTMFNIFTPMTRITGKIVGNTLTIDSYTLGTPTPQHPALAVGMRVTDWSGGRVIPCYVKSGGGMVWTVDGIPQTTAVGEIFEAYQLDNGNGCTIKNVKIDRNNVVQLEGSKSITLNIVGYKNVVVEDVEIWGNGCGFGMGVGNCVNVKLSRLNIHDIAWILPVNPGSGGEQAYGLFVSMSDQTVIDSPVVKNIEGFVNNPPARVMEPQKGSAYVPVVEPALPASMASGKARQEYQNTDGIGLAGNWNTTVENAEIWNVGEGIDVSGSRSVNTRLVNCSYYDCNGYAEKTSSEQWKFMSIGARAYRSGFNAFVVAGSAAGGSPGDITWINAHAYDTGYYGVWKDWAVGAPNPPLKGATWYIAGFSVQSGPVFKVRFIDCKSHSIYQEYAAVLLGAAAGEYELSNFDGAGYTVSEFLSAGPTVSVTEFNSEPTGYKVWGGITSTARIVGVDIHAANTLTVDGNVTLGDAPTDVHTVNGNMTVDGSITGDRLIINGPLGAHVATHFSVDGNTTLGDGLTRTTTVNGTLNVDNTVNVTGQLDVSGPVSFADEVFIGSNAAHRYAYFQSLTGAFAQLLLRYDDTTSGVALNLGNHGIAGVGGGSQMRFTIARGNAATGQFGSAITTLATEDWTTVANQSAEVNVAVALNGVGVDAATFDGTRGITSKIGIGYEVGAGATAIQATNKTTAVTCNGLTGQITMAAGAIAQDTSATFTLNNNKILSSDFLVIQHTDVGTMGAYTVTARVSTTATAVVTVRNLVATTLNEQILLKFMVLRSAIT